MHRATGADESAASHDITTRLGQRRSAAAGAAGLEVGPDEHRRGPRQDLDDPPFRVGPGPTGPLGDLDGDFVPGRGVAAAVRRDVDLLGALAGVLGSLMALEAIREIVGGFGEGDRGLVGRLLMIDARAMRFETLTYAWDPANPLSGATAACL